MSSNRNMTYPDRPIEANGEYVLRRRNTLPIIYVQIRSITKDLFDINYKSHSVTQVIVYL